MKMKLENKKVPECSGCGKVMSWTKAKDRNFFYWKCETPDCKFIYPVYKKELTKNEQNFIKELNN